MKFIKLIVIFALLAISVGLSNANYCNNSEVDVKFSARGITFTKKGDDATVGFIFLHDKNFLDCFLAELTAEFGYTVVRLNGHFGEPNFEGVMHSMSNITQWNVGGYGSNAERALEFVDRVYPQQYGWVGINPQFNLNKNYSRLVGRFLWIGFSGNEDMSNFSPQLWLINIEHTNANDLIRNTNVKDAIQNTFLFSKLDPPRSECWAFIDRNIPDLQTHYHNGVDTPGYYHIPAKTNNLATDSRTALLYVPGGAVASRTYLEQLRDVAYDGYHVFVQALPLGNANIYPNVDRIYQRILTDQGHLFDKLSIAGHSLGSLGAGNLVVEHSPKKENTSKIRGYINVSCVCGVNVTNAVDTQDSIFGTRDAFPVADYYQHVEDYMNDDTTITVIEGGNHAQMSGYNMRYGPDAINNDTLAEISRREQHQIITTAMTDHLAKL